MASAQLFTHERHSHPNTVTRDNIMKRGPKTTKLTREGYSDPRALKRKSMSLNNGGSNSTHAPAFTTVDLTRLTRDQICVLRKKLKLNLEEVRSVASRLDARVEVLRQLKLQPERENKPLASNSDSQHVTRDSNCHARKDVTSGISDPASSSGETPREMPKEMSQREARLARQPSVTIPDPLLGTPGFQPKRTPKANQLYLNSEFVPVKDKLAASEKSKTKRILPSNGEVGDPKRQRVEAARAKREAELLKQCSTILRRLMTHKHGWVFNEAVNAEKLGLHDYHMIIKKPMDLGTVKKRLSLRHYTSPVVFADDVELTLANAMMYNPVGHDVHIMAQILKRLFEDWWKGMLKKLEEEKQRADIEEEMLNNNNAMYEEIPDEPKTFERDVQSFSREKMGSRGSAPSKPHSDDTGKRPMTFEEKRKLSVNLESLPGDKLEQIVQIIKKQNPDLGQNEDEIEVDIDMVDNDTLWELDRFVTNYMKSRGKKAKSKTQMSAAEGPETGGGPIRKSRAGVEVGEEDVDIDDDMVPTKFAPVVIEKAKESSSSGSSSNSGSSDSDSDSASSSGSESDAEEGKLAGAEAKGSEDKDPVGSGLECDRKGSPTPAPEAEKNDAVNPDVASPEQQVSSPPRQVSPEKALRAALLRGRFADIIVKAQEKTTAVNKIGQNDKGDPEKVKKDREVLEKRQREEKARLLSEAKVAEATKRKAEAYAALLEKQKREVERGEARRALQQMEKTVEIDENSGILKDLERLRSGPLDSMLGSSHDGGSHEECSPDGLSTFALQGGNPLEQLGLFMKDDEDEDEHHEAGAQEPEDKPVYADSDSNEAGVTEKEIDVEDGEIDVD